MKLRCNAPNLINLKTMLALYPKQARYAIKNTLNDMAKDIRTATIKEKNSKMTFRNKTLARKSITYQKATLGSINQMYSLIGSSAIADRFTGFGEQEGVKTNKRKRYPTKKGRTRKRAVIPREIRADREMIVLDNMVGKKNIKYHRNAIAYMNRVYDPQGAKIRVLGKSYSSNGLFRTQKDFSYKRGKMKKGIHKLGTLSFANYGSTYGKKRPDSHYLQAEISTLQIEPDSPETKLQPKENQWLRRTTKDYFRSEEPQKRIEINLKKQVTLIKKWGK